MRSVKKLLHRFLPVLEFLKNRWKLALVLLGILGGGFFWYTSTQSGTDEVQEFVSPVRQNIIQTLEVSGVVDAKQKARLRFLGGGKVVYLGAKEGEWVKRGQTIATIDRAALEKQFQQQLNAYTRERNEFEDFRDEQKDVLLEKTDERARDNSQLFLNDSVLSLEQQAIALQNTSLYAPFEGLLTSAPTTTTGVQLAASDVFEIIQPSSLIFRAAVDEADIAQVLMDLPAELTLDAYPDDFIRTNVSYISFTSSESSSGTVFIVEFPLNQETFGNTFRLGMNGDIAIELDRSENVLTIPLDATRERDGKTFVDVRTTENGADTITEREITTGIITNELVEVVSGLSESDSVLLP